MKILVAGLLVLLSTTAPAQPVEWSQDFNRPGLVGRVFALGTYEGELYAGGYEFEARGSRPSRVARFDGSRWRPLVGSQGEGVSGQVRAMAVYQGELVVAGHFGGAGGIPASGVAAWDGSDWRALGDGLQLSYDVAPTIFALEVFQGELYAGGLFDRAEGEPVIGIARWDGSSWRPVGGGIDGPYAPKVLALESDPLAGVLYVGGEFDQAGGVAADNIASWDGASWQAVGAGIPGPGSTGVHALAVFGGDICAGGNFALSSPAGARRIACFDGLDWQALGNGIPDWDISTQVSSLQVHEGNLFVGGNFIEVDGEFGVRSRAVARWDGAAWHSVGGIEGTDLATTAIAMTSHAGRLIVGGEFKWAFPAQPYDYADAVVSWSVAGYDGTDWHVIGEGLGLVAGPKKMLDTPFGRIAIGAFYLAGDQLVGRIARLGPNGWEQFATFDRSVNDAVMWNGDLVVTGDFSEVDGQPVTAIARYDGTSWSPIGSGAGGDAVAVYEGQLYAGGLGGYRRWNGTSWEAFGPQMFGQVETMHVHDGRLFIGGSLGDGNGVYSDVMAWDGAVLDNLDGGANDIVTVLYTRGPDLLVGGYFSEAGGQPAERLAVWNNAGWQQYRDGVAGVSVEALIDVDGMLYVGGNFTTFYGHPASFLLRDNDGTWEGLGTLDAFPRDFLVDHETGELWMFGIFRKINGIPTQGMTRMSFGEAEIIFRTDFEPFER